MDVDPFTQRMLERAQQRAKNLGITTTTKFPLTESNQADSGTANTPSLSSSSLSSSSQCKSQSTATSAPAGQRTPQRTPQRKQSHASPARTTTTTTTTKTTTHHHRRLSPAPAAVTVNELTDENCGGDVELEINITTGGHVQLQVEVEEREIDEHGNVLNTTRTLRSTQDEAGRQTGATPLTPQKMRSFVASEAIAPVPAIRDTSRNRLQRLGALYSDNENLSSPIHRNEARFDSESVSTSATDGGGGRPTARSGKLAALADSIKTWEDESVHASASDAPPAARKQQPPFGSPAKKPAAAATSAAGAKRAMPAASSSSDGGASKTPARAAATPTKSIVRHTDRLAAAGTGAVERSPAKQLKWDKTVMDSLEAQGFMRRQSNAAKMVYDYTKEDQQQVEHDEQQPEPENAAPTQRPPIVVAEEKKKTFQPAAKKVIVTKPGAESNDNNEPKSLASVVTKGLVSGRAALFETGRNDRAPVPKQSQKDPAEMSLKDRLALFEKNKGTALVPKAAFGMSASHRQISGAAEPKTTSPPSQKLSNARVQSTMSRSATTGAKSSAPVPAAVATTSKIDGFNKAEFAESNAAGNCIRSTVAALMNKGATISQSEIAADVRQQREREMNVLLNRFQRSADDDTEPSTQQSAAAAAEPRAVVAKSATTAQPPPPPPPPPTASAKSVVAKRKSGGGGSGATGSGHRSAAERQRDRDQAHSPDKEEAKRKRVVVTTHTAANRLYPVLSDIESTTATESDAEDCTTAVVTSEYDDEDYADDDDDDEAGYENIDAYGRPRQQNAREADFSFAVAAEDEDDDDIANISLGREIMQAVRRNGPDRSDNLLDTSTAASSDISSAANVTGDMDDYLDEALADEDDDDDDNDNNDDHMTPRKQGSISSNSFHFARSPAKPLRQPAIAELNENADSDSASSCTNEHKPIASDSDYRNPIKSELRVDPSSDSNIVTLTHTVSFYRRQQASVPSTPVRKVTYADQPHEDTPARRAAVPAAADADAAAAGATDSDEELTDAQRSELVAQQVADKVRRLLDEIRKQEQIMSQTSQALNLCAATIEFSGSAESVEGERHLLVASHRRQAALNEVQRLRVERCLRADREPIDQGRLTVKEITVPLKAEYKDKLTTDAICGHQLVCLLKYNETVVATRTVPTLPGLLAVKFPDVLQMDGVYADFRVQLEIYGMRAQRENVPHELKYHINRKRPTKGAKDSRLVMPPVQSPGGPGAVRTPALTHYGMVIFSLREIQRTNWTLHQVSSVSPLAGNVYMKANMEIKMHIDMRGFLTMFEDVSGFGAWHRRWCRLHNTQLSYWRYPDDEKTKAPIGTISLKQCWTQKVQAVARDVCARQHTMELEIRRPTEEGDRDSLVLERKAAGYTVLRHLLSADTKDERVRWSRDFNKALMLVRSWGMGSASGTFQ